MFQLFDSLHITYLIAYTLVTIFIFFIINNLGSRNSGRNSAIIIAGLKISELVYRHLIFGESWANLLPLHLCNISLIISIIFMFTYNSFLFQLAYFWSIGAIFALLTPEVRLAFPAFWHISFFVTHFYLLFVDLYGIIKLKIKPTLSGYFSSVILLNLLAFGVFFINKKLGTNYMFLNYKPAFSSPLDFFGPWPLYIIPVEILFFTLAFLAYLPFRKKQR